MFTKGFLLKVIFGGLIGLIAASGAAFIMYVKPWAPSDIFAGTVSHTNIPWANCAPVIYFYDRSTNEDDFRVYRRKLGASTFALIQVVPAHAGKGQQIYLSDTPLPTGTYEYKASAYNQYGESYSDIVQVTVNFAECTTVPPINNAAAPTNPTIVSLDLSDNCHVRISYRDNSTNEQGFRIYRALYLGSVFYDSDITVATLGPHTGIPGTYDDKTVLPAGTYRYRMSAYNASGQSFSNFSEITIDPVCDPTLHSLPTKIPATQIISTAQKLSTETCTWEAAENVFLRKGPDVGIYDKLVSVAAGQIFPIVGQSEDGHFWAVEVQPGVVGYITKSDKYSLIHGDCATIPTADDPAPPTLEPAPTKKPRDNNNGDNNNENPAPPTPCPVGAVC